MTLPGPLPPGGGGPTAVPEAVQLAARVRLQAIFRLLVAVALLVATAAVHFRAGPALLVYDFRVLYAVIGVMFATGIPVLFALRGLRSVESLSRLSMAHFLADVASTTALVYITGGPDSPFVVLYALTIINAATVLFRRGALLTAGASIIAYGTLVDLAYYGILRPFAPEVLGGTPLASREALYRVGVTTLGFLFTGLLASYFADQLRRTGQELEEKRIDLRELQAITKNIVENIVSGLLTVDRDGRISSFNKAAEEITGLSLNRVYGEPLASLFPSVAARIREASNDTRRYEESFARADGTALALGFSCSPLRNDAGEEIGMIVIFQDLTELREMETRLKREERLAAVGRLAAGIAHEIRNPLASISGSIEMLRGALPVASEDRRLMDIILRETDRLDGLITEFLAYVKPVKHRMRRVPIADVLAETIEALHATEAGRNVRVVMPPPGSLREIRGDRDPLKQVAWNLLLNAAQAMKGSGTITIRATEPHVRLDVLSLEFADDGPGIPAENLPHIFEPFFTTREHGTGLGLAIVHKIVEGHGGHIEVDSEPGKGTAFRIVLPRWREHDAEDALTGSKEIGEASGSVPAPGRTAAESAAGDKRQ